MQLLLLCLVHWALMTACLCLFCAFCRHLGAWEHWTLSWIDCDSAAAVYQLHLLALCAGQRIIR